ncbi:MAG: M20/M25/M40 family metallo-hydrolase, partial [Clostridia bacterium]|nr:M20/M25/M40 family metallo-hydrolase [Clostridia bacterium]
NALSLMAAWLTALEREMPFAIASLDGGDKSNAIPRECTALLILDDGKRAKEILQKTAEELRSTCNAPEDTGLCFAIEGVACKQSFAANETRRILRLLSLQTGVIVWRADGTPQLSRNVAAVHTDDNGLTLVLSVRSAEQGEIDFLRLEAETLAEELGAVCTHSGAYPGWESSADSALVRAWQQAAAKEGINATPTVIHAGLECGLFSEKLPGLTAISVGCNIHDLHTPAERMELSSFARTGRILFELLKNI